MLVELLLVGGWLFWGLLLVVVALEVAFLANYNDDDEPVAVHVIGAGALLGTILFTDALRGVSWWWLIPGVLGYVVMGVLWSFKKWYDYVVKEKDRLVREYGDGKYNTGKDKPPWPEYVREHRPKAIDRKAMITTWMTHWPFSFSWWVLTWPRRLFTELWRHLVTTFDRISDGIFNSGEDAPGETFTGKGE